MKSKYICILVLLMILCGCDSSKKVDTSNEKQKESYIVEIDNIEINIDDEYVEDRIKGEKSQYEVTNCAIGGTNIVHIFDNVEITTYTNNKKELIYSIVFTNPSIASKNGIKLGLSKDEVVGILNNECEIEDSLITKDYGAYQLNIVLKDDVVISVEYLKNS